MNKKNIWLVATLAVLAAVYVCFFTDWFKPRTIRVYHIVPSVHSLNARYPAPVLFGLIGRFRLTEIKVVPLADFQTNPATPWVWHLVSDSNSVPVTRFAYGQHIHGMRLAIKGDYAEPLETNVVYRLFIAAGGIKGIHDFEIKQ